MVIEAAEKDLVLPWNVFLERQIREGDAIRPEGLREQFAQELRNGVNSFRLQDWKNIKRDLLQRHHWELPDGLEPHWIGPGTAVYWQQQVRRERVERKKGIWSIEDRYEGWAPTLQGLPANNASQIAHYLDKGLRLRPPDSALDAKQVAELLPEGKTEEKPQEFIYFCGRHPEHGSTGFRTWEQYIKHCDHNMEPVEFEAPAAVKERMQGYKYFCILHNTGFNNYRLAYRHWQVERRLSPHKKAFRFHQSVSDMRVKKEE